MRRWTGSRSSTRHVRLAGAPTPSANGYRDEQDSEDRNKRVSEFPACPFEPFFPAIARADAALADPTFSQGVFFIAPGTHAIEFENKALWSETSTRTARAAAGWTTAACSRTRATA
jgi:hypothetical protein